MVETKPDSKTNRERKVRKGTWAGRRRNRKKERRDAFKNSQNQKDKQETKRANGEKWR